MQSNNNFPYYQGYNQITSHSPDDPDMSSEKDKNCCNEM